MMLDLRVSARYGALAVTADRRPHRLELASLGHAGQVRQ
jgi:hypothetical protein